MSQPADEPMIESKHHAPNEGQTFFEMASGSIRDAQWRVWHGGGTFYWEATGPRGSIAAGDHPTMHDALRAAETTATSLATPPAVAASEQHTPHATQA